MKISKKGVMEWEYLAAIVLVLVVVVVSLLFSETIKGIINDKFILAWEGLKERFFP